MTQTNGKNEIAKTKTSEISITDQVLTKILEFQRSGQLNLPKDYDPATNLKAAYLVLLETVNKDGKPVLETCTKTSIANALLGMVVQGLSPIKKQCYFISYGDKLNLSRSYQGTVAIAKRAGMKDIVANVIYENDTFSFEIDTETGRHRIIEHKSSLDNIDINKIKGAYAVVTLENGAKEVEVMTIAQIKNSWMQGYAKGNSPAHSKFTDEMCKKTVISRACKGIVNSSNDSYLLDGEEEKPLITSSNLPETANTKEIGFTEEPEEAVVQPTNQLKATVEQPENGSDDNTDPGF